MVTATIQNMTKDKNNITVEVLFSNGDTEYYSMPSLELLTSADITNINLTIKAKIQEINSIDTAFETFKTKYIGKVIN